MVGNKWIPLSVGLPEVKGDHELFLVYFPWSSIPVRIMWLVWNGDYWSWNRDDGYGGWDLDFSELVPEDGDIMPTHWMKLPDPPE